MGLYSGCLGMCAVSLRMLHLKQSRLPLLLPLLLLLLASPSVR